MHFNALALALQQPWMIHQNQMFSINALQPIRNFAQCNKSKSFMEN